MHADRDVLPQLPAAGELAECGEAAGGDEPHAGLETTLAQLWAEVLKIERVGRNDDFFAMGGNSLLSTQLVAKVRERIPQAASMYFDTLVRELLPEPTVAAMAPLISFTAAMVRPICCIASAAWPEAAWIAAICVS